MIRVGARKSRYWYLVIIANPKSKPINARRPRLFSFQRENHRHKANARKKNPGAEKCVSQRVKKSVAGVATYFVFDLLALDGRDLTSLPLLERKSLLKKLLPRRAHLRYSDHVLGKGKAALEAARRKQLEGVIAKKIRSPYRPGERTDEWLKIKTHMRQEAVIGGFTEPKGSRKHLGALVLGVYEGDRLVYAGQMGGGFNRTSLKEMRERLEPLIRKDPPFAVPPREKSPITWVDPVLVCEVTFSEWTSDGIFRQPIFTGLREDKNPREVVREGFSPG